MSTLASMTMRKKLWLLRDIGSLKVECKFHDGRDLACLVHRSIPGVWANAWHTVGVQSLLNIWKTQCLSKSSSKQKSEVHKIRWVFYASGIYRSKLCEGGAPNASCNMEMRQPVNKCLVPVASDAWEGIGWGNFWWDAIFYPQGCCKYGHHKIGCGFRCMNHMKVCGSQLSRVKK